MEPIQLNQGAGGAVAPVIGERGPHVLSPPSRGAYVAKGPHLSHRSRRVLMMLAVLWVLNVCDLLFTIWAHEIGGFLEVNPVARCFLAAGLLNNLVLYKLTMCLAGSLLLLKVRHHPLSEVGCIAGLGLYAYVSWLWFCYYQWAVSEHPITLGATQVLTP